MNEGRRAVKERLGGFALGHVGLSLGCTALLFVLVLGWAVIEPLLPPCSGLWSLRGAWLLTAALMAAYFPVGYGMARSRGWPRVECREGRLAVLLALLLAAGLTGCGGESNTPRAQACRALDMDLTGGSQLAASDTHGGFHGDGLTFVSLQFSNDRVARELENRQDWQPLPLSRTVTALAYGLEMGAWSWGPYVTGEDGERIIPPVQNGLYYFQDRSPGVAKKGSIPEQPPVITNFTVAIYDTDQDILYYAAMDT